MADDYLGGLRRFAITDPGGYKIELPYRTIRIRGGLRKHTHEYPYVPGGLAEKLGRKPYQITVDLGIDEGFARLGYYQGRNLLTNLNVLMSTVFEAGETVPVYLPNIGEMKAFATEWDRELDVRLRSGEKATITMEEDSDAASLVEKTLKIKPPAALASMLGGLEALSPKPMPGLLEQLRDAINQILAFRDQTQMWAGFIAAKIEGLELLFEEIDSSLEDLKNPESWELLEALRNLWGAVRELGEELGALPQFATVVTPRDMSAAEVSMLVYGDTQHAIDVLSLNALEDPYNIPAGTTIRYFAELNVGSSPRTSPERG